MSIVKGLNVLLNYDQFPAATSRCSFFLTEVGYTWGVKICEFVQYLAVQSIVFSNFSGHGNGRALYL